MLAVPVFTPHGSARAFAFDAGTSADHFNPFAMDAPELIEWLEGKEPQEIGNWRELGGEEYARAFTAARTIGYDIVRDMQNAFLATMREPGATGADFSRRMIPIMRERGWLADATDAQKETRLDLIWRTNLRTAQAVGQWQRIQRVKAAMPYLLGFTAADERVRHPPKLSLIHI